MLITAVVVFAEDKHRLAVLLTKRTICSWNIDVSIVARRAAFCSMVKQGRFAHGMEW